MIEIKKIEPQKVDVFDSHGKFVDQLNEYEFADLRAQIAEQKVWGYSIVYKEKVIQIDIDGTYIKPIGLFDCLSKSVIRILRNRHQ